ncbi:MAG: radical SAM protein [Microthrixaceae bacterium]
MSATTPTPARGGPRPACWAPRRALYFQPDGEVLACCVSGWNLGTVTGPHRRSLADIWSGAAAQLLRERLDEGRFDLGCQECEAAIEAGGRGGSMPAAFDRFAVDEAHGFPQMMDFALSSRCNLQCVMCNGELSSSIRTQREHRPPMAPAYDDRFFEELDPFLDHLRRALFKGGEPFLARENRVVWDRLIEKGSGASIVITTNGTVWNDEVEHYIRSLRADLSISVDAVSPDLLESIRLGVDGRRLWRTIDTAVALAEELGTWITLNMCLMTTNWQELPDFLRRADRLRVSANVIHVNQPERYDLTRLPPDELTTIVAELRSRTPSFRDEATADIWERTLDRLDHVGTREPSFHKQPVVRVEEPTVKSAVSRRGRGEPLRFVMVDGVIVEADCPSWAERLDPTRWIGVSQSDLPRRVAEFLGARVETGATHLSAGDVLESELAIHFDDESWHLHCKGGSLDSEGTRTLWMVVRVDGDPGE